MLKAAVTLIKIAKALIDSQLQVIAAVAGAVHDGLTLGYEDETEDDGQHFEWPRTDDLGAQPDGWPPLSGPKFTDAWPTPTHVVVAMPAVDDDQPV
jgi:hypothetical protein